jgi:hypothetical protein
VTLEERLQALEREDERFKEWLREMESLTLRVAQANYENALAIGQLSTKIDQFVDAVFHRGGNGNPQP